MSNVTYEVNLTTSSPHGSRIATYLGEIGWEMDRLDNGVLVLFNEQTGSLIEYSPYAWQSVRTENIDTTEDDLDD